MIKQPRILAVAGLAVLLAFPTLLQAQVQGLEVRPADGEQFTQEPRQVTTVPFIVRNATGRRVQVEPRLVLPPGWRPITQEFPFELAPGQVAVRLVSFMIPEAARAGVYAATYEVRDRQLPAVRSAYTVRVHVTAAPKLHVLALEVPTYVIAGESYVATFLVRNTGNAAIDAQFKAQSVPDGEPTPPTGTVTLEAGESKSIGIRVATAEVRRRTGYYLTLTVAVPGTAISDSVTGVTHVVPRVSAAQAYHTLPAQFDLSYVMRDAGGQRTSGWQTQLSGAGTLDEENTRLLSFLFRGPDLRDKGSFGTFDEYWLDYRDRNTAATVGDYVYALSPLTELGRYGRGARLGYEKNALGLSGYRVQDRFSTADIEQAGFNAFYRLTAGTRIDVNLLDKSGGNLPGTVQSVRSQTLWAPGLSSDLEAARSEGEGERGRAFRGNFYDGRSDWRYYAIGWRADPEYRGYFRDQEYLSTGFDYGSVRGWGLRGYYRLQNQNLHADPVRPAPKEQQANLGTDYTFATATRLSLDYNVRTRVDQRAATEFDLEHQSARIGVSQPIKNVSLLYNVEAGDTEDRITGARFDTALHVLSAYWKATEAQSYSIYAVRDDNAFSNELQGVQTTVGLNANYNLSSATFFNLNAQRNRGETTRNSTYNLSLFHQRRNGDRVTLLARRIEGTVPQTDMLLTYTVPFDLPVRRKAGVAPVRGRIFDADTGAGLRNVVLNLDGLTAVSGNNGEFEFPAVKAGSYQLSIDRSNIDVAKVPVGKMPLEVVVNANQPQQVEIGLIRSVSIGVQVRLYPESTPTSRPILARGMENVLVTLRNGERVYRRLTDIEGRVRLAGLAPGKWTATISADAIPEGYEAASKELTMEAAPGGYAGAEFPVTAVARSLKMLPPLKVK